MADYEFDVFISHASEDKAAFVAPLAIALRKYGLKVWYDDFELRVGDSLRNSIETGLARSRYGVVVFSPKFLSKKKPWPKAELNALFSREMDGHKVILPIRHNVSSKKMKSVMPIQADKKALKSTDGVESVARSLVEVIRPELLHLETRQRSAFDSLDSYIAEARRNYPGYDFVVRSGNAAEPQAFGTSFIQGDSNHRVDIRITDRSLIPGPPGGTVKFFGTGINKAIEFQRTGKAQQWLSGEFQLDLKNLPLAPPMMDGSTLSFGHRIAPKVVPRHMRVEMGAAPAVVFPIMEMRAVRMGTQESEAIISDKESPLSINLVFPIGPDGQADLSQKMDIALSFEPDGKRAAECRKMIEAVDALRTGGGIRIIDIRLDRAILDSDPVEMDTSDPFSPQFRRLVFLACRIEQEFSVPLRISEVLTKDDEESLFHLDCLLNNAEYGAAGEATLKMKKGDGESGEAQAAFLRDDLTVTHFAAPTDYPGFFALLGQRVVTRPWVRAIEFVPANAEPDLKAFSEAPVGTELEIKIVPKGPMRLQWQDPELASLDDAE